MEKKSKEKEGCFRAAARKRLTLQAKFVFSFIKCFALYMLCYAFEYEHVA